MISRRCPDTVLDLPDGSGKSGGESLVSFDGFLQREPDPRRRSGRGFAGFGRLVLQSGQGWIVAQFASHHFVQLAEAGIRSRVSFGLEPPTFVLRTTHQPVDQETDHDSDAAHTASPADHPIYVVPSGRTLTGSIR
ncbi:hypothetical protein [Amycolatopsis sp. NPDC003861]